jgi:hypothetical protein
MPTIFPANDIAIYDPEPCEMPIDGLLSNSLLEVCNFAANAAGEHKLVSLKPTAAAYLPSWVGYLLQALMAGWDLVIIFGV